MRLAGVHGLLLTALSLLGCPSGESGDVATQVQVLVRGDGSFDEGDVNRIVVSVRAADSLADAVEGDFRLVDERDVQTPGLPMQFSLLPRDGDAGRAYLVEARAYEGSQLLATGRLVGGYRANERILVTLLLTGPGCEFNDCAWNQTCDSSQRCVDAAVNVLDAPSYIPGADPLSDGEPGPGQPGGDPGTGPGDTGPGPSDPGNGAYALRADVQGLQGTGLFLRVNGTEVVGIDSDGVWDLAVGLPSGSGYSVDIEALPGDPPHQCVLGDNASGTIEFQDVIIPLLCMPDLYAVGVEVFGLEGEGLLLGLNEDQQVEVNGSGYWEFERGLVDGSEVNLSVDSMPTRPAQDCVYDSFGSRVQGAPVRARIDCTTLTFPVNVSVEGLRGSGLTLGMDDGQMLEVFSDGIHSFGQPLPDQTSYQVDIQEQPQQPAQVCGLEGGAVGMLDGQDDSNVVVRCETERFSVGGSVEGLMGRDLRLALMYAPGEVELLDIYTDGSFNFAQGVLDGDDYMVYVERQPTSPSQVCAVQQGATGTLQGASIDEVLIRCEEGSGSGFTIGGRFMGLEGSGLVIQLSDGQTLPVDSPGSFSFPSPLPDGFPFGIQVLTQPSDPIQTCSIDGGVVDGADQTDLLGICQTLGYTVSGTLSGLAPTDQVQLGLSRDGVVVSELLDLGSSGSFSFVTPVPDGGFYDVTVVTQPDSGSCSVAGGRGMVSGGDVSGVVVACQPGTGALQVNVSGLPPGILPTLVLQDPSGGGQQLPDSGTLSGITPDGYTLYANPVMGPVDVYQPDVFASLVTIVAGQTTIVNVVYSSECEVAFADAVLEMAVRKELGLGDSEALSCTLVETQLTELYVTPDCCGGVPLQSLEGLQRAVNLQVLSLEDCLVTDLSPLSGLARLQIFMLPGCRVSDLSPLNGLASMTVLGLGYNDVSDLMGLESMSALETLELYGNALGDFSLGQLAVLTSLSHLDLSENPMVSELSSLRTLENLRTLYVSFTNVASVEALRDMKALRTLDLGSTNVRDLEPLAEGEPFSSSGSGSGGGNLNLDNTCVDLTDVMTAQHLIELQDRNVMWTTVGSPRAGCDGSDQPGLP